MKKINSIAQLLFLTCIISSCEYKSNPIQNKAIESESSRLQYSEEESSSINFKDDILPIIKSSCLPCHGNGAPKNWLNYETVKKEADVILSSVKHEGNYMPMPLGRPKLTREEISLINKWVENGYIEEAITPPKIELVEDQESTQQEDNVTTQKEEVESSERNIHSDELNVAQISSGEEIYDTSCKGCHDNTNLNPKLKGLKAKYIKEQLLSFTQEGGRQDPTMKFILQSSLQGEEELTEVSNYIESLDNCKGQTNIQEEFSEEDKLSFNRGEEIFKTQCLFCHSNDATAVGPNLYEQNQEYLSKTLKDFKNKIRPSLFMEGVSSGLSDEDIFNISFYLNNQKDSRCN